MLPVECGSGHVQCESIRFNERVHEVKKFFGEFEDFRFSPARLRVSAPVKLLQLESC